MSSRILSDATVRAQRSATDPHASVVVAANAGSGKTHVLTERVVRLLLDGADPAKILCLTYTKAAAAEMSTRVFNRLAAWATAADEPLRKELAKLLSHPARDEELAAARRLFATALETPGGLKIQTIHAFCEAILHQFPLEANVPGHFQVLDDKESALVLAEARRRLVTGDGHPPAIRVRLNESFAEALARGGEWGLDGLLDEIVSKRDALRRHVETAGGVEAAGELLFGALGVGETESEASIRAEAVAASPFTPKLARTLLAAARSSTADTDVKLVGRLEAYLSEPRPSARHAALASLVLDSKGEARASIRGFATKAVADRVPGIAEVLAEAGAALRAAEERVASLGLARASRAALVLADRLEEDYAALKRRRGRLDFEDLVVRTADLLSRSEAAGWVHYKLDQGIDHVLIDEAQDTSPRQWQVMNALVEEFFVGASARGSVRTVFAVGDEKQSIYSFQGASPGRFAAERRELEARARGAGLRFSVQQLHQSFRSTRTVLDAVDRVFADPANRAGLSADDAAPAHETARGADPGLVEVWPAEIASPLAEPEDWLEAVDVEPDSSPANRLARRIAARVADWLGRPVRTKDDGWRPLTPGDVLVLVRKRSGFVDAMSKALRDRGIPVAGADRLVLTDHIAVEDLVALGRAVANAEDELSLAACLKSPLFGMSDDELMALALSRDGRDERISLYSALRNLAGDRGPKLVPSFVAKDARGPLLAKARDAFARFETLRDRIGFSGVFAFYARILGPEGGRARLVRQLGTDAGEVVDAFLDLALAAEEEGRMGLDSFLADLCAAPPEIKREMEHGRSEVRIMTVHASKGLEAPAVFLVDPGSAPFAAAHGSRLMRWEAMPGLVPGQAPGFVWRAEKALENGVVRTLRETEKRLAGEEYRRLLYVGMTRAADRLVVCGTAGVRGPDPDSWLSRVRAALEPDGEPILGPDGETVTGWRLGGEADGPALGAAEAEAAPAPAEPLHLEPLPPEAHPPRPLAPSTASDGAFGLDLADDEDAAAAGGSPVLGGDGAPSAAIRRGLAVHRMFQVLPDLPRPERRDAALRFLERAAGEFSEEARTALADEVLAILDAPRFAAAFAPGSRAEVALSGTVELGGRLYPVSGAIDRLAVSSDGVLVVDYKTGRPPAGGAETVPDGYLVQLALYRRLMQPLYPDRPVRAVLLFTEGPRLIDLPEAALEAALAHHGGGDGPSAAA